LGTEAVPRHKRARAERSGEKRCSLSVVRMLALILFAVPPGP
jgi:hypothetical protein